MRVLVLGGTWFVGRVVVEEAVRRGYQVTAFNRGRTAANLPNTVGQLHGDRQSSTDLARLSAAGPWDAVIDVPGVVPAEVRDAARVLGPATTMYAFVSTVSAYRDWPARPVSEDSPLHTGDPDADPGEWTWGTGVYGPLKAGAELALRREFDIGRLLVVRPSAIIGPYEYGGRLPWWLHRCRRGGTILVPGMPTRELCPVDVRDLATFVLDQLASGCGGTFNVGGPRSRWEELIGSCLAATGGDGAPVWVDDDWLVHQGVRQWTELPLWRTAPGTWSVDTGRAQAAGLVCRPLADTVIDTWAWLSDSGRPVAHPRQSMHGLDEAREEALLAAWAAIPRTGARAETTESTPPS